MWHGVPKEPDAARRSAEDSLLNKSSKLQTANEAVFTEDLAEIARLERERVAAYANETARKREGGIEPHTNGQSTSSSGSALDGIAGDKMMIADDVRVTNITRNGISAATALMSGGLIGLAIWAGTTFLTGDEEKPEEKPPAAPASGQLQLRHLSDFPNLKQQ